MSDWVWIKKSELDALISASPEAKAYANDPATDRTFLAAKFLESMLREGLPTNTDRWVKTAFEIADKFVKKSKETGE